VAAIGVSGAGTPAVLVVPFSFGFGLLVAIFAFGHISGAPYNPAVTIASALDRRLPAVDAVGYIVGPVVGGIIGWGVYRVAAAEEELAI
jgi:aquaporin Z